MQKETLVSLSKDFLLATKTNQKVELFIHQIAELSITDLQVSLNNDDSKKAFWINLYNAFTKVLLQIDKKSYLKKHQFFNTKKILIAGKLFSLDDIEHGILRHSKNKWSLGYFNKICVSRLEKKLRVEALDFRIHFALNCGAKSCPPIAFYDLIEIDKQLDIATKSFLINETSYEASNNIVYVSMLLFWFRGDFGGNNNIKKLLKKLEILLETANPRIKYKKYNWTIEDDNFLL